MKAKPRNTANGKSLGLFRPRPRHPFNIKWSKFSCAFGHSIPPKITAIYPTKRGKRHCDTLQRASTGEFLNHYEIKEK